jgi:hypothetical protein
VTFGIGLALVLTVNDPVSLDTIPDQSQGQASGVSTTAEQFGGALGISRRFSATCLLAVAGLVTAWRLVRRPVPVP